jgi:alpha-glucosidase
MRIMFLLGLAATLCGQTPRVVSPDGQVALELTESGDLSYTVSFKGKPVLARAALGLELQGQAPLGPGMKLAGISNSSLDESYRMPHGKANPVRNHYHALIAEYAETGRQGRRLSVEVRAYNDGVGFRYVVPQQPAVRELRLAGERTEFRLAKDGESWALFLAGFRTSYEDNYHHLPVGGIHPEALIGLPFLAEVPGVGWVGITEAHLENWAGLYLRRSARNSTTLEARLAPRADEPEIAVSGLTPMHSPWRTILIGEEPGRLIESNIVVNLNPPSAIADTSWIRAGKSAWDWWSGSVAKNVGFKQGMNTDTMKHYIDFAAEAKLEYMLIDEGWAGRGEGKAADITQTNSNIDMPEILRHAASKNVKVWLWAHWTSVDKQMNEAFALFQKWGVAGVKIDFMDRDDQWMVDFYHRVVKKAAEHRLMIDFHGAYKPDGGRRTWPNLMTQEGVLGLEYVKWSGRATPGHNVTLAFTRMLAGPLDYTPGGFDNRTRQNFVSRFREPVTMGTRAHQLALFVVFESPFMVLADHPEAYRGQKELAFLSAVPATWDETRVLKGRPDEFVAIARRSGREWYIGAITDWDERELELPLEFLGAGDYTAEMYTDAPDAAVEPKHTTVEQKNVTRSSLLKVKLAPGGGAAIRIRP